MCACILQMLDARKLKEYEKQKKKHEVGNYCSIHSPSDPVILL